MKFLTACLVILNLSISTWAHSWIECSDYKINSESDSKIFNPDSCSAYARGWKNGHTTGTFGLDTGYDHRPSSTVPLCKYSLSTPYSSMYNSDSPMAQYSPGQKICLAWPSKNHVAATCINPYIPDGGLKVYMSGPNPTSDPTSVDAMTLVHDFGANSVADEMKGFQNCPNFCSNPDKSTCSGCFNLPSNIQPGAVYTFVWLWAFNSPTDLYSSCWEAQIVGTSNDTQSTTGYIPSTTGSAPSESTTESTPSEATTESETEATTETEIESTTETEATTQHRLIRITTGVSNQPLDSATSVPCTKNSDCESQICEVGGVCRKKVVIGTSEIIAIACGGAAFLFLVIGIMIVLFRYRLKRVPYI